MSPEQAACLRAALHVGYHLLDRGGTALMAVEQAIRVLERSALFNAGKGAYRQLDGVRRMDASIMEGQDLRAGAVASIEGIVHPITAARLVIERTTHVLLVGPLATRFARQLGNMESVAMSKARQFSYAHALAKMKRSQDRHGTVGAVALDQTGMVAAGASTGGIDVMLPGRVGDTPIIGCGVYADNEAGAVSMTGWGEGIMRVAAAKSICDGVGRGQSPAIAARSVLQRLSARTGGTAGTLVLTPKGTFAIRHVTSRMAAGWWNGKGDPTVGDEFQ